MRSNIWALVEMIIVRVIESPGRACNRVRRIDGSCKIVNDKVWRAELLVMSAMYAKSLQGEEKNKEFRIRDDNDAFTNMNRNLYRCSLPGLCCLDSPKNEGSRNQV